MSKEAPKLVVGFITYGETTAKYLPYFLPSLTKQKLDNFKILVLDNTEGGDNTNTDYIKNNYPDIEIISFGENLGFAKAYNIMIEEAVKMNSDYFCVLNPDTLLVEDSLAKLTEKMDEDGKLGSVSPKILKWDFDKKEKTDKIDTLGIEVLPGLRFIDARQGDEGKCEYEDLKILGPSGAAGIYRISSLKKIKFNDQYFDELMFMYKEDCDLAYRLYLAGFKSFHVNDSVIYHDRTVGGQGRGNVRVTLNRRNRSKKIKKWSFLNQHIIFLKFWRLQSFFSKIMVLWFAFKMFVFVLIFERYLLKQYLKIFKIKNKIKYY